MVLLWKSRGKPTFSKTLQFRAAPKNAVHFLYGAALHRPALLRLVTSVFQKPCAKAKEFGEAEFLGWFAGSRLGVFSRLCEPAF